MPCKNEPGRRCSRPETRHTQECVCHVFGILNDMRLICVILAMGVASAATTERYDLGALKWRNIGPNRGGRSQAAAGSQRRPLEYYFGAVGGGLWKTVNG